ncbi:hypothetical protein [Aestuariivita boseongensis]|uniref:hypothetical protein n=1 Tax=Aestuariivita boseongensis TaxID=1470562 RepID=UPI0012FAA641|nr:hypothetical protein [Aestuariivita boseongensis]
MTPQTEAGDPTIQASNSCKAALITIGILQRKGPISEIELAKLQANRRAEAEWRADIRQHDRSSGVEARMDAAIRQTRPDGQWTTDGAWLRRSEAAGDPISRLRNDDLCVGCTAPDSLLDRLERHIKARCGLL